MNGHICWATLVLATSILMGCGTTERSPAAVTPPAANPTSTLGPTPIAATPSAITTPPAIATPSSTPPAPTVVIAQEKVMLTLPDCSAGFWDPHERELRMLIAADEPGILNVMLLDANHARMIYDIDQLNREEAIRVFEKASGFEVIATDP